MRYRLLTVKPVEYFFCGFFWLFLTFFLYFQVLPLTRVQLLGLLCPELQVSATVLCSRPIRKMYQFLRWVPKRNSCIAPSPPVSHNDTKFHQELWNRNICNSWSQLQSSAIIGNLLWAEEMGQGRCFPQWALCHPLLSLVCLGGQIHWKGLGRARNFS